MASSFTDDLILMRNGDGALVLKLERRGIDAVPEEEWDAEAFAELYYEADVESPEWLLDFIEEPPWKVADRVQLPDAEEVLRLVAIVDPGLAAGARQVLEGRKDSDDET